MTFRGLKSTLFFLGEPCMNAFTFRTDSVENKVVLLLFFLLGLK